MSEKPFTCDISGCPSFEGVVDIFLNSRYARVVDDYRSILEEDPEYLSYHGMSTALRLQFQLKRKELPQLGIGACFEAATGECCIVSALREAIRKKHPRDEAA